MIDEWRLEEMKREAVARYERSKERMLREMDEKRWSGEEDDDGWWNVPADRGTSENNGEYRRAAEAVCDMFGWAALFWCKALAWAFTIWMLVALWPVWVLVIVVKVGWPHVKEWLVSGTERSKSIDSELYEWDDDNEKEGERDEWDNEYDTDDDDDE